MILKKKKKKKKNPEHIGLTGFSFCYFMMRYILIFLHYSISVFRTGEKKTEIDKYVSTEINCGYNALKFAINKSYL